MAISVENRQFFSPPVYIMAPLKGFPLELGSGAQVVEKFEDRFSGIDTIPGCAIQPPSYIDVASTALTTSRG